MTMITPSYLGETIEYSSLHACRSTLEDPTPLLRLKSFPVQAEPIQVEYQYSMQLRHKRVHYQPEMTPTRDEQVVLFLSLLNEFHVVHHKAQSICHELLPQGPLTLDAQ